MDCRRKGGAIATAISWLNIITMVLDSFAVN
jgi:hypothetical protein